MSDEAPTAHPPEFRGFFEHAAQKRVAFPRCNACSKFHWYPMPLCPHCQSTAIAWQPISGKGELFSFTDVRHAFDKSRREALPYVVGMVTFAEAPGVRLITNIIGCAAQDLKIGQAVEPVFATGTHGEPLVHFRLAERIARA